MPLSRKQKKNSTFYLLRFITYVYKLRLVKVSMIPISSPGYVSFPIANQNIKGHETAKGKVNITFNGRCA